MVTSRLWSRIDEDKYPCLKRDSKPRSQRPSDQGQCLTPRSHWGRLKRVTRIKTCSCATLSTTNFIYTNPDANPSIRREKPATNRLSHGTATGSCQQGKTFRLLKRWEIYWLTEWLSASQDGICSTELVLLPSHLRQDSSRLLSDSRSVFCIHFLISIMCATCPAE
jgi:hypothetical protein